MLPNWASLIGPYARERSPKDFLPFGNKYIFVNIAPLQD